MTMQQAMRRGIFQSFNSATYTATVLFLEATSAVLSNVPVACHIDGTSAQVGAYCVVLFFDAQNYTDAVVVAVYPNGTQGIPTPPPGRVVFVAGVQQVNAVVINSGVTNAYTLPGGGSGIPVGALGVLYKAFFTSPTVGASIALAPHGGTIGNYQAVGNIQVANQYCNGGGLLQLDASGQIDIKAQNGNCTVSLYTHGYVF